MEPHGKGRSTFVIAEAGVNHNGSLDLALELASAAKRCGADAVKFQAFSADRLVAKSAGKAEYQKTAVPGDDFQHGMLKSLELSQAEFTRVRDHCAALGIAFLVSPFDEAAADDLDALGLGIMKIPSGEITNLPFLRHIGAMRKSVILSTGMSWLGEVETAVQVLEDTGTTDITLLHCVTEYPAPIEQINLRAMTTLAEAFGLPVGYSDHTPGIDIAIAAVALGATIIEKHLTIDASMPGPDHSASLEPAAFAEMVSAIRNVELALGDGRKRPAPCELPNLPVARKSIVAARAIAAGHELVAADLTVKRPGSGIAPAALEGLIGRRAARDIAADEVLTWSDLG